MLPEDLCYPYLPKGKKFLYVPEYNPFMEIARKNAQVFALDDVMPASAVIVKEDRVIGHGSNGSMYHREHGCRRMPRLGSRKGQPHSLCPGCSHENHSEAFALRRTRALLNDPGGADLYLWGHWWCCAHCWDEMIRAGIHNVYLLEKSWELFNREHPRNIVGRQKIYIPKYLRT